jgi:hypothetical protein
MSRDTSPVSRDIVAFSGLVVAASRIGSESGLRLSDGVGRHVLARGAAPVLAARRSCTKSTIPVGGTP